MPSSCCPAAWARSTFEMVTWLQLGLQAKPVGIVNQSGYFDRLLDFLHHASAEGFVRGSLGDLLLVEPDPEALLRRLQRLVPDDPAPGAQPQSPPR